MPKKKKTRKPKKSGLRKMISKRKDEAVAGYKRAKEKKRDGY